MEAAVQKEVYEICIYRRTVYFLQDFCWIKKGKKKEKKPEKYLLHFTRVTRCFAISISERAYACTVYLPAYTSVREQHKRI